MSPLAASGARDSSRSHGALQAREEPTGQMPIVAHESISGVDCCGCIIAAVEDSTVELQFNECGAVVGVIQIDILCGCSGWTGEGGGLTAWSASNSRPAVPPLCLLRPLHVDLGLQGSTFTDRVHFARYSIPIQRKI